MTARLAIFCICARYRNSGTLLHMGLICLVLLQNSSAMMLFRRLSEVLKRTSSWTLTI